LTAPGRNKTIRNLVIFAVLVNAVACVGRMLGGDPAHPGIGFLLWGAAPILVSVLMRTVTRDWSDLGARPEVKFNIGWYFVSLIAYPFAIALVLVIGSSLSVTSITGLTTGSLVKAMLPAVVVYFLFAIFEEVGWRGYLAPKMYSLGINIYLANALVAVVWASWHLPYIVELSSYTSEGMETFLPRFYLGAFAFSLVYGEIRIRTGSFWPAVLMHWMGNAIANPLVAGFVALSVGKEYLGSIGVDGVLMIALFGFWGVMLIRQRQRDQQRTVLH